MKLVKHTLLLLLAASALLFTGCKPDEQTNGNFTLQVNPTYGSSAFVMNAANTDPDGRNVKFNVFQFYLSNITLIKNDNSEVLLKNVALVDLKNSLTFSINGSEMNGDFKAIKFGVGLDSALNNNTNPGDEPIESPLYTDNNLGYWGWMKYIFYKVEGVTDTTTSGQQTYNNTFLYHIGTDNLYREVTLTKNFSICCNNSVTLNLNLDVKKIFYGDTETIDIVTQNVTQTTDNSHTAVSMANNFPKAFSL
jgi:hypothetical protein